jgi:hypothetical protein
MAAEVNEKQYIFIGHSIELFQPYEERPKVPPGVTLLLLAECDRTTGTEDVNRAIELATQVPIDQTKFRVYKEGDLYPNLELGILGDFFIASTQKKNGTKKYYTAITRSGVYSVPIDADDWQSDSRWLERHWTHDHATNTSVYTYGDFRLRIPNSRLGYKTYKHSLVVDEDNIDKKIIQLQFEKAVYPPKQEIKEILAKSQTVDDLKKYLRIPLPDLFEKLGPGLYIVPTCRRVKANAGEEEQDLFTYIEQEIYPDLESRLNLRTNHNMLKYRKQKLNLLNSLKNHPKLQEDPWKQTYEKVRNSLRKIVGAIQNTRSKSVVRQRGGKTRKTSRRK